MGATIVEKHFTLDNDLPGPDHQASLSPMQLTEMISNIRTAEKSMGSSQKEPTADELLTRDVARRSIALEKDIERGQIVKESDIQLLRPGTGIPPSSMDEVIGMVAISNLRKGEILNWSDLEA
jgi:sialic acid synthase SpsE